MGRWINADTKRTVMVYDDEHEENILKKMTIEEMCYAYTEEGVPIIFSGLEEIKWVPCSERLPEDDDPVLVYLFESNSPYIAWVSDCEWFTEEFQIEKECEPKAWMALPDPFESEEL